MWMNEWNVQEAEAMWGNHPTLGPATRTLRNVVDMTNHTSDGWPYWQKPSKAADKLMDLIQNATNTKRGWGVHAGSEYHDPTVAEVKATYRPLKAFRTRMGGKHDFEIIEP